MFRTLKHLNASHTKLHWWIWENELRANITLLSFEFEGCFLEPHEIDKILPTNRILARFEHLTDDYQFVSSLYLGNLKNQLNSKFLSFQFRFQFSFCDFQSVKKLCLRCVANTALLSMAIASQHIAAVSHLINRGFMEEDPESLVVVAVASGYLPSQIYYFKSRLRTLKIERPKFWASKMIT